MSHADFTLTYGGPALASHEMNVRDLAPAMLAVGEAFEGMNALFNGKSAQLAVNVRAHQPACFKVAFDIVQIAKDATPILTGPGIVAANNLLQLLIGVGTIAAGSVGSLIWLIRVTKGKNPDRVEKLTPGLFRLFIGDQTFEVNRPGFAGGRFRQIMQPWGCRPAWRSNVARLRRAGCCRWARAAGDC